MTRGEASLCPPLGPPSVVPDQHVRLTQPARSFDSAAAGYATACPAEKSGQAEFDSGYGADYALHIEAFDATFSKVLARYNPEGDGTLNRRHAERLRRPLPNTFMKGWRPVHIRAADAGGEGAARAGEGR
jgi:hypothetical protein